MTKLKRIRFSRSLFSAESAKQVRPWPLFCRALSRRERADRIRLLGGTLLHQSSVRTGTRSFVHAWLAAFACHCALGTPSPANRGNTGRLVWY